MKNKSQKKKLDQRLQTVLEEAEIQLRKAMPVTAFCLRLRIGWIAFAALYFSGLKIITDNKTYFTLAKRSKKGLFIIYRGQIQKGEK